MSEYFDTEEFYEENKDDEETIRRFNRLTEQLRGLPLKKQEEILESVATFCEVLYQTQGLPVEQAQEIIDNIQDEKILKFLEEEKKKLS